MTIGSKETLRDLGTKKPFPPEKLKYVEEKIKELQRQHARDLDSLFIFQADELRQLMLDHRRCIDDSAYMDIDESYPDQVEFRNALRVCLCLSCKSLAGVESTLMPKYIKDLEIRMRECPHHKRALEEALSSLRYTYLKALLPLLRRRRMLRDRENDLRKRREATFPKSIEEYRKISDREVQLRVARFLMADSLEQEKMMDKFGWAYRGVDPLRAAYKSNVRCYSCGAPLISLDRSVRQAEFNAEIQELLKDIQASDPRKRNVKFKQPSYARFDSLVDPILPYATFPPVS